MNLIIKKLDRLTEHILIHTGQNYSKCLTDIFFKELELRQPDYFLEAGTGRFGSQAAAILKSAEELFLKLNPDKVLILGDTDSGLAAISAERLGIPVYHMEAGNRCFDRKVPEEINRKIIDSISTYALPFTPGSRENLLREGLHKSRIFMCGNPINEVLQSYSDQIEESDVLNRLKIEKREYLLVTAHRAENVDIRDRLEQIMNGLNLIQRSYCKPVIFSVHPRTRSKLAGTGLTLLNENIILSEPFGFFDFIKLEKNSRCVLTDSGTVQEECCIFHVPTVTMRDSTERPETVECGSNMISGLKGEDIQRCTDVMLKGEIGWKTPEGYDITDVSEKVVRFIMGENRYV